MTPPSFIGLLRGRLPGSRLPRPRLARRLQASVVLVVLVGLVGLGLTLPTGAGSTAAAAGSRTSAPILAADYFGTASPINVWGSDTSGAAATFAQMKADGFNTVGLVLPWGDFEPGLTPVRFNQSAFAQLDQLIGIARSQHLGVILRLSYDWDVDPADQLAWGARFAVLGSNPAVYQAWLSYISKVHQNVARFANVRLGYLSWEDYWLPVEGAQQITSTPQQIALASSSGYRQWLRGAYSLSRVSSMYGTHFATWAAVPTPSYTSPSFRLMYQFDDWLLVHKLFDPAAKRFPGLELEARVDVDPVYGGSQVVGSYSHADTFRLPGAKFVGTYFSPYMGDPSSAHSETASEALAGLGSTLSHVSAQSGGRPLFIFEFEIVSNTPVVASDPSLSPTQVSSFVQQAEPALHQYTNGYALFTYRDFNLSPVDNPSFSSGLGGWSAQGPVSTGTEPDGSSYASLGTGASLTQTVPPNRLTLSGSDPVTVSMQAMAPAGSAPIELQLGNAPARTVTAGGTWQTLSVTVPQAELGNGALVIRAGSAVRVSAVQLYGFTQQSDLYSTTGTPESAVASMTGLNEQLAAAGTSK